MSKKAGLTILDILLGRPSHFSFGKHYVSASVDDLNQIKTVLSDAADLLRKAEPALRMWYPDKDVYDPRLCDLVERWLVAQEPPAEPEVMTHDYDESLADPDESIAPPLADQIEQLCDRIDHECGDIPDDAWPFLDTATAFLRDGLDELRKADPR